MHIRLVFTIVIFFVSILGGFGPGPAYAGFCTVEDIQDGVNLNVPAVEILAVCTEVNVSCPAQEVYQMILDGLTADEIYYSCE